MSIVLISAIAFSLLFLLYIVKIISYYYGWQKLDETSIQESSNQPSISLIIAFKNNSNTLNALIDCIKNQTYKGNYECILVNDHSANPINIVLPENFQLIHLPPNKTGKKNALEAGAQLAKNNVLLFTDADCLPQRNWIFSMVNTYTSTKATMVSGPVSIVGKGFFKSLQALEFMSLVSSGAGAIGIKKPIMCNGANILIEKESYIQFLSSGIGRNYLSGDDMFLLEYAKKEKHSISFSKNPQSIIHTPAKNSLKSFISQRLRWTKKSGGYTDAQIIYTSFLVYLTNTSLAILPFLYFFDKKFGTLFFLFFFSKLGIDYLFLDEASRFFNLKKKMILFPILQILYVPYIVLIPIVSIFWKERWK